MSSIPVPRFSRQKSRYYKDKIIEGELINIRYHMVQTAEWKQSTLIDLIKGSVQNSLKVAMIKEIVRKLEGRKAETLWI